MTLRRSELKDNCFYYFYSSFYSFLPSDDLENNHINSGFGTFRKVSNKRTRQRFGMKTFKTKDRLTEDVYAELWVSPTLDSHYITHNYENNLTIADNTPVIEEWLELYPDGDLGHFISKQAKKPQPPILRSEYLNSIVTAITHTTLGLKYLHSRNYLHRDIKPQNIVYNEALQSWAITDLGTVALSTSTFQSSVTGKVGTPFVFLLLLFKRHIVFLASSSRPSYFLFNTFVEKGIFMRSAQLSFCASR